jgi:hypothetical protein
MAKRYHACSSMMRDDSRVVAAQRDDLSVLSIHPQESGPALAIDESHRSGCLLPLVAMMKAADPG